MWVKPLRIILNRLTFFVFKIEDVFFTGTGGQELSQSWRRGHRDVCVWVRRRAEVTNMHRIVSSVQEEFNLDLIRFVND